MSPHWPELIALLILVLLANAAPAILGLALGPAAPVDGGRQAPDGRPLLGPSKTWRGLAAALILTPLAAMVLGLPWQLGLLVALGAMTGDLLASFTKRRLGARSSTSMPFLDTIPESLIPGLLVRETLGLGWVDLVLLVCAFGVMDLLLTPLGRWAAGRLKR